jgi:hypothetical protein
MYLFLIANKTNKQTKNSRQTVLEHILGFTVMVTLNSSITPLTDAIEQHGLKSVVNKP